MIARYPQAGASSACPVCTRKYDRCKDMKAFEARPRTPGTDYPPRALA